MPLFPISIALLAAFPIADLKPEDALDRYIAAHPMVASTRRPGVLMLTSQKWRGKDWNHDITQASPRKLAHKGIAILAVTGGVLNQKDMNWAKRIADKAGVPVFNLFDVPNQPIWDKWEDDLVAHSFAEYLKSGDESWPLLFPMANSAIRAMDAIQKESAKLPNPIKKFVITGESKRGWTTWLLGTVQDKRIAGIAPFIYDNLNIPAQLGHQQEIWGHFSPMYQAYKNQGLLDILETDPGKRLVAMVDPFSRIELLKVPVLNVIGSNDPFWAIDASGLYWGKISDPKLAPKSFVLMLNRGHDFPGDANSENALAAFARSCAGEFRMPDLGFNPQKRGTWRFTPAEVRWVRDLAWTADSASADFSQATWRCAGTYPNANRSPFLPGPSGIVRAVTVESQFRVKGLQFSIYAPPKIIR